MRSSASLAGRYPILALALISIIAPLSTGGATSRPSQPGAALRDHLTVLASDELKGRATGEAGCEKAAAYIENQFMKIGLRPAPGLAGYRQEYQATLGSVLGPDNRVMIPRPGQAARPLTVHEDYNPFGFSGTGRAEAPIVFVGYGITAPEYKYDDYAGVDVKGKIVLVLRHEPQQEDSTSVFNGTRATRYSEFRTKARVAEEHGAAGIIVVTDPLSRDAEYDDLIAFGKGQGISAAVALPAIHVKRKVLDELWGAGLPTPPPDLKLAQKEIDATLKSQSFAVTGSAMTLAVDIERERKTTWNVVGWLPPTGTPAQESAYDSASTPEHLAIGAHYDHLGMGGENSLSPDSLAIHNGADDNASGVSALIEVARALAEDPTPRPRGVLFAAFSGEELGLLGSAWLVGHSPLLITRNVAMLNMDMVGRMKDDKLQIGGVGTSPRFRPLIEQATTGTSIKVDYSEGGFGPSDHSSFYAKQRPVLFFFTGLHEDYHRPSDDVALINFEGLVQVTGLVTRIARTLVDAPDPVPFQLAAADTGRGASEGGGGGYGAYLGTIPDFGDNPDGVKVTGVGKGSPAELAGIRGDDIIVAFGTHTIRNLYDLTDELRAHRPGDVVEIGLLRGPGKEKLKVTVTLRKREGRK